MKFCLIKLCYFLDPVRDFAISFSEKSLLVSPDALPPQTTECDRNDGLRSKTRLLNRGKKKSRVRASKTLISLIARPARSLSRKWRAIKHTATLNTDISNDGSHESE